MVKDRENHRWSQIATQQYTVDIRRCTTIMKNHDRHAHTYFWSFSHASWDRRVLATIWGKLRSHAYELHATANAWLQPIQHGPGRDVQLGWLVARQYLGESRWTPEDEGCFQLWYVAENTCADERHLSKALADVGSANPAVLHCLWRAHSKVPTLVWLQRTLNSQLILRLLCFNSARQALWTAPSMGIHGAFGCL